MMLRAAFLLVIVFACGLVSSCSNTSSGEYATNTPVNPQTSEVYTGGPDEYYLDRVACYGQYGLQAKINDGDGILVDPSGFKDTRYDAIVDACNQQLGQPSMVDVSQEELQARYEWRVEQNECLIEGGYVTDGPISFEEFVDSQTKEGWEPINEVADELFADALSECPYSKTEW